MRGTYWPLSLVRATRYIVAAARSITGVPWMPTLPTMLRSGATMSVIGTGVTAGGLVKSRRQRGAADGESASNAYTLSFMVATYRTLRTDPPMVRPFTYNGCA